jgi:hypothetical protein
MVTENADKKRAAGRVPATVIPTESPELSEASSQVRWKKGKEKK